MAVTTVCAVAADRIKPAQQQATVLGPLAVVLLLPSLAAAAPLLSAAPATPTPQACPAPRLLRCLIRLLAAATAAALTRLKLLEESTALLGAAALVLVRGLLDMSWWRHKQRHKQRT